MLRDYVAGGGTVVITGPAPTGLDAMGTARGEYALADVLGFRKADPLPERKENRFGAGTCHYLRGPGLSYLSSTDQASADRLLAPVRAAAPPAVTLQGDRRIHLEVGGSVTTPSSSWSTSPTSATLRAPSGSLRPRARCRSPSLRASRCSPPR
ncbi:hypothetical protein ACFQ2B_32240 [Streptomyces stramineus]